MRNIKNTSILADAVEKSSRVIEGTTWRFAIRGVHDVVKELDKALVLGNVLRLQSSPKRREIALTGRVIASVVERCSRRLENLFGLNDDCLKQEAQPPRGNYDDDIPF